MTTADKVIDIAFSYLGCKQGDAKMKKLVAAFNTVKPHGETARATDPWCAIAWTAWQILAGNKASEVPMSYNCGEIVSDAKRLGIWIEKDSTKPKKGWAILYDWNDSGSGDNVGGPDHIGLVYAVDDKWIYVIEGNKGAESVCGKRAVQINGKFIRGFVAPKYATPVTKAYTPTTAYKGSLPKKTVRKGSKGSDVKAVQEFLNWCIKAGLKVDGKAGSKTVAAIKKWQKQYKLKVDGVFGPASRKKAQAIVNAHKPKPKPVTEGAKKILAKAKEYAWPYGTAAKTTAYKTGKSKPAFKTALQKWMKKKAKISQSDCGYFVSTCVRASGVAPTFLALPGSAKKPYPAVPATMKIVSKGKVGTLQSGDVIRYRKTNGHQHTVIFLGDGMIAHAGRGNWFPKVAKGSPWNNSNVKKSTIQVIRAR